jgi:hypothetical protein
MQPNRKNNYINSTTEQKNQEGEKKKQTGEGGIEQVLKPAHISCRELITCAHILYPTN